MDKCRQEPCCQELIQDVWMTTGETPAQLRGHTRTNIMHTLSQSDFYQIICDLSLKLQKYSFESAKYKLASKLIRFSADYNLHSSDRGDHYTTAYKELLSEQQQLLKRLTWGAFSTEQGLYCTW